MDTRQVLILARGSLIFLGLMFLFDERWEQPRVGDRVFLCIILDNYSVHELDPKKVERKATRSKSWNKVNLSGFR